MITILTAFLSGIGRKAAFWGAIAFAIGVALWVAFRRGRLEAEAERCAHLETAGLGAVG